MLKLVVSLIMVASVSWSQDQAKGSGSKFIPEASSSQTCPATGTQRILNEMAYPNLLKGKGDPKNALLTRLLQVGPAPSPLIRHECIDSALSNVTAGGPLTKGRRFRTNRFFKCDGNQKPFDNQDEPCTSVEYKTLVHNSFELTTKCLKEFVTGSKNLNVQNTWVEGYFKMLSTESGMHVNVASQIGAIGIGQLLPEYIADFKQRTLPDLKAFLQRPETSAGCKRIGTELLTDEKINKLFHATTYRNPKTNRTTTSYKINTCANIDINDGQPLLNLVISFGHLRAFKDSVATGLFENPKYMSAFKGLSLEQITDLEIKMVSWSYNLGANALVNHMQRVLDTKFPNKMVKNVNDFVEASQTKGKHNYIAAVDERYQNVLKGLKSCRTDLSK